MSDLVAAVVLLWVGYPILRKTLMAAGQRVVNANVLLSTGTWGAFGIDEVHAELLPQDKVTVIERLQRDGRTVAMVGDGINDAPVLVQSDVSIALGAGTDVAMESAGVVLVSDTLDKVVAAILLGRASHRKMQQNIEEVVETVIPARRMHCEVCSRTIVKSLSAVEGVRTVLPDVARKEILVAYEPSQVSEQRLREQLTELGFR